MNNTKEMSIHELASSKNKNLRKLKKNYLQWVLKNKTTPKAKRWAEEAVKLIINGDEDLNIEWVESVQEATDIYTDHKREFVDRKETKIDDVISNTGFNCDISRIFDKFEQSTNGTIIDGISIPYNVSNKCQEFIDDTIVDHVTESILEYVAEFLEDNLPDEIEYKYKTSIVDECEKSLVHFDDSITETVSKALSNDLHYKLNGSTYNATGIQAFNSHKDAGWLAYYRFFELIGLVEYPKHISDMLKWYERLIRTCEAMYIIGNNIILVEK